MQYTRSYTNSQNVQIYTKVSYVDLTTVRAHHARGRPSQGGLDIDQEVVRC